MFNLRSLIRFFAVLTLVTQVTGPLAAAEHLVRIPVDRKIVAGTLEIPDGPPAPVVLMLHSFTGARNEYTVKGTNEGLFIRTARQLSDNGYASLRIDFRGSGESDGDWADTTFSGQIADALTAVDWLRSDPRVDGSSISVLGWSQGGLVAAHTAAARPDIKAAILWSPVSNPLFNYTPLLGGQGVLEAIAGDPQTPHTSTLPWGVSTTLNGAFYRELPTTSPAAALAGYDGALLVIVGSKDTVVTPQPRAGQLLLNYHPGTNKLVLLDMNHSMNGFDGPATLDEKMIPTTLDWLNVHK